LRLAQVLLYGSQARGSAKEDSDIDLLVVLKGEVDPAAEIGRGSQVTAPLSLEYDTLIMAVYLSQEAFRLSQDAFMRNLRQEGIAL
jgi:uncharacterized protein